MAELTTYRAGPGNYAALDETLAAVQADLAAKEAEKEKEKGKGDNGRGDAILDGAPKPVPGDELYDTLFQARAEKTNEQGLAARYADDPSLAALLAAYALTNGQDHQQSAREDATDRFVTNETRAEAVAEHDGGRMSSQALRAEQSASVTASFPEAAKIEIEQPNKDHQGRASVDAMGMEGPGPTRPGRADDATDGFVTAEIKAEAAADWQQQAREIANNKTMGPTP